jgi:hypothetical protein
MILQGIVTKYHGPTNSRGARISATSASGIRIFVPLDHGARNSHHEAALRLAAKLDWPAPVAACTINERGDMAWSLSTLEGQQQ